MINFFQNILRCVSWVGIGILKAYQWVISPLVCAYCRYTPTCSQYAIDALKTHPFIKAVGLILKRLGSCHRWSSRCPIDPVPPLDKGY